MATKVTVTRLEDAEGWTKFSAAPPPSNTLIEVLDCDDSERFLAIWTIGGIVYWDGFGTTWFDEFDVFSGDHWRLARPGQSVLIEAVAE